MTARRHHVSVSAATYQSIRHAASARSLTMGELVAEMVERERVQAIVDKLCEQAWPKARCV